MNKQIVFVISLLFITSFIYSKEKLNCMEKEHMYDKTLSGDKISSKILFEKLMEENKSEENEVLILAAENDPFSIAGFNLGSYYEMYKDKSPLNILRSKYWFSKSNNSSDELNKVSEIKYSCKNKYVDYEDLLKLYEAAMLGDETAPWILYNYCTKLENLLKCGTDFIPELDNKAFWLRIGAQNGNIQCQRVYGKLLKAENDNYSQKRGIFWLEKIRN